MGHGAADGVVVEEAVAQQAGDDHVVVAVVGGVLTTWQPAVDHLDDHRLALLHAGPNLVGGPAMEPAIALIQTVRSHAIPLGHPRQRPDERARVRVGVEEVLGVEHLRTEVGRRQIQAKRLERHAERRRPTSCRPVR